MPMKFKAFLIILLLLTSCQSVPRNINSFEVQFHPDGKLYVGDQLSLEVFPNNQQDLKGKQVSISVEGKNLATADFSPNGIGQREQATFWWAIDTTGWEPGKKAITFSILPGGSTWDESITIYPENDNPYKDSVWETKDTDCCTLHYITGTDAAREITELSKMVDLQADDVEAKLSTTIQDPIDITFLPKLIGQGGFATNSIYVSYLDANITGDIAAQVIHHEMVHILDSSLGGEGQPAFMVEGLAVYLSNGHYKQENLLPRSSYLLDLNAYIPLTDLLKDFYNQQHEIAYLEAGAMITYMVDKYGWDDYKKFYGDVDMNAKPSVDVVEALSQVYGLNLEQLEAGFIDALHSQEKNDTDQKDLALTIAFFDSIRLYQQKLDPSTYYATAWLPDGATMQEKGIVADYLRSDERLDKSIVENLLRMISRLITDKDYKHADWGIKLVNGILALYP